MSFQFYTQVRIGATAGAVDMILASRCSKSVEPAAADANARPRRSSETARAFTFCLWNPNGILFVMHRSSNKNRMSHDYEEKTSNTLQTARPTVRPNRSVPGDGPAGMSPPPRLMRSGEIPGNFV
jgi:hypothetical protein|mmetsp:Transcript_90379/g.151165  ORF Transcript_90379/g.151165 Transcript_90379/m.151165 type:complete len:125 (-) Transcript_90379:1619-1993(-)